MAGCGKLLASPHSVTLSWTASKSPVVGYNVYRTLQGDESRQKLTPLPIPETKYVDSTVEADHIYIYFVTAVDSKGAESIPSASIVAMVPSLWSSLTHRTK